MTSISRSQKRARVSAANRLFKKEAGEFKEIDLAVNPHPSWMKRAFMNNRYVVMIDDNAKTDKGIALKAMIQKHDDTPIVNHWSEIQAIKNELFGSESVGIEYYPKESELINDHNIYWLWIFPEGVLPMPLI
jgi:hypothetical protein